VIYKSGRYDKLEQDVKEVEGVPTVCWAGMLNTLIRFHAAMKNSFSFQAEFCITT
jgi:hypothetical protein